MSKSSLREADRSSRITRHVIVIALILAAFALRVWNLSAQSVWWDEAFTYQVASHGWNNLWHMLLVGDRNPPLYFLSLFAWGGVAGWSEFCLRFLSVIGGVVGVVFLYTLAARLSGSSAGLWTAIFASISPSLVTYSQEGRMYSLFFALSAATLYFGVRIAELGMDTHRAPRTADRPAFLVCESLLLFTHYFAVPLVIALNLFAAIGMIRRKADRRAWLKWIAGQTLAVAPILIWTAIVFATPGSLVQASESRPDWLYFSWQTIVLWMTGVRDIDLHLSAIFVGSIGLIVFVAIVAWLEHRLTRWLIAFWLAAFLIAFVLASVLTAFHPRYLLAFSLPLFVLFGAVMSNVNLKVSSSRLWSIVGGLIFHVMIILTLAGWAIALDPQYAKDDARGVAAYLRSDSQPDDVILIEANDYTLSYYNRGLAATKMITASTEPDAFQQISSAVGDAKRVWLMHWNVSAQDRRSYWRFLLEQSGRMIDWTSFRGYELYEYEMKSPIAEPHIIDRATVDFAVAEVVGWSDVEGQHDGALTIAIGWQKSNEASAQSAKVALRLIDSHGSEVTAVNVPLTDADDNPPAKWQTDATAIDYYVLPVPPGTPPLAYTLSARVYEPNGESSEQALGTVRLPRQLDTGDPYRTLSGYQWQSISSTLESGLNLEAFSISPKNPKPLDQVDVTLRWRKIGSIGRADPHIRLTQNDRAWADLGSALFEHDYPIEQWLDGEMVIEHRRLIYPPIAGEAQLQIGQGDHWTTLLSTTLDTSALSFAAPSVQHSQSVSYGDFAKLLGYDLSSDSIAPDRAMSLTLYWQALNTQPITTPYTVFTQLIAPDGHLVAQHDGPPQPIVKAWIKDQIIADRHQLRIVDPTYRGPARLIVGWYNSATIERLKTIDGEDHVLLQTPIMINEQ